MLFHLMSVLKLQDCLHDEIFPNSPWWDLKIHKKIREKDPDGFFPPMLLFQRANCYNCFKKAECFGAFFSGHFPYQPARKRSLKERSTASRLHPNLGVPKLLMIMKVITPPWKLTAGSPEIKYPPKRLQAVSYRPKSPKFFGASSFQPLVVRGLVYLAM